MQLGRRPTARSGRARPARRSSTLPPSAERGPRARATTATAARMRRPSCRRRQPRCRSRPARPIRCAARLHTRRRRSSPRARPPSAHSACSTAPIGRGASISMGSAGPPSSSCASPRAEPRTSIDSPSILPRTTRHTDRSPRRRREPRAPAARARRASARPRTPARRRVTKTWAGLASWYDFIPHVRPPPWNPHPVRSDGHHRTCVTDRCGPSPRTCPTPGSTCRALSMLAPPPGLVVGPRDRPAGHATNRSGPPGRICYRKDDSLASGLGVRFVAMARSQATMVRDFCIEMRRKNLGALLARIRA